jgi:hypothetical protein
MVLEATMILGILVAVQLQHFLSFLTRWRSVVAATLLSFIHFVRI